MLALGGAAGITVDRLLSGRAIHARGVVGGVAHARGAQFGQHCLQRGAQFGGDRAAQRRHAVGFLAAQGEAASAGAVVVGVGAVGVQAVRQPLGQSSQLLGPVLRAQPG